jgi:hypothetical protein
MAPPPKKASERRDKPITLKLSTKDRVLLGRLVEARAAELHRLTGQTMPVTIASLLRWLWERDAYSRGLTTGGKPGEASPSLTLRAARRRSE